MLFHHCRLRCIQPLSALFGRKKFNLHGTLDYALDVYGIRIDDDGVLDESESDVGDGIEDGQFNNDLVRNNSSLFTIPVSGNPRTLSQKTIDVSPTASPSAQYRRSERMSRITVDPSGSSSQIAMSQPAQVKEASIKKLISQCNNMSSQLATMMDTLKNDMKSDDNNEADSSNQRSHSVKYDKVKTV